MHQNTLRKDREWEESLVQFCQIFLNLQELEEGNAGWVLDSNAKREKPCEQIKW